MRVTCVWEVELRRKNGGFCWNEEEGKWVRWGFGTEYSVLRVLHCSLLVGEFEKMSCEGFNYQTDFAGSA